MEVVRTNFGLKSVQTLLVFKRPWLRRVLLVNTYVYTYIIHFIIAVFHCGFSHLHFAPTNMFLMLVLLPSFSFVD